MSQIKFKTSDFSEMLNAIRGSIPSDSDVAFVKNGQPTIVLKFDGNTASAEAHNYENSVISSPISIESDLGKCAISVPASWILSAITKAPADECVLSIISDDEIKITSGRFRGVSEYWQHEVLRKCEVEDLNCLLNGVSIDPQDFIDGLQFASHFMAKDDVRYYLNGVAIDIRDGKFNLVGANGHILGVYEYQKDTGIDDKLNFSVIIPYQSVSEFIKFLKANSDYDVKIKFDQYAIEISGKNNSKFFGMFINGKFADWRTATKNYFSSVSVFHVDKMQFVSANDRVKSTSGEKGKININWKTQEDLGSALLTMELQSDTKRKASEDIHIELVENNSTIDITLNSDYVHKVCNATPCETLKIGYQEYDSPIVVSAKDDNRFLSLLTPIRR